MSKIPFDCGRLVISKQGRDAGRMFLIMEVINDDYVLIADGDLRKVIRPKRKKVKHLIPKPIMAQMTVNGLPLTDSDVRKAINAVTQNNDQQDCKEGCALVKR